MAYTGFVTTLKNVHKHPNADRLQMGECGLKETLNFVQAAQQLKTLSSWE